MLFENKEEYEDFENSDKVAELELSKVNQEYINPIKEHLKLNSNLCNTQDLDV